MIETNFQHTGIGHVPYDWRVVPLKEVASLFGRIGFRGYTVRDLVPEGQGAITLSPTNIRNGVMNYDKCTYISWAKYNESPEIMVQNGDILMVKTGSTYGKTAYVDNLPCKATINPQFVVVKKIKCNSRLLAYLMTRKEFQSQIEAITSGGAIPTMSQAKILVCQVAVPGSDAEQKRIASTLCDMEDLIQDLRALIAKKQDIKTATMQQLLSGKTRLKGFSSEWVEYKLKDLAALSKGKGLSKGKVSPMGKYKCMLYGEIFTTYDYVVYDCVSHTDYYEGFPSIAGDVVMPASTTTCGRDLAKAVAILEDGILLGGDIIILRNSSKKFDGIFLAALLTDMYKDQVEEVAHGVTIVHLTTKNIENFCMRIPADVREQQAIAKVLVDMTDEIAMLQERLQKYEDLRSGMMQQLLTGKIRLI